MGREVATMRSSISGGESNKKGKDGASWCSKRKKKIKDLTEPKEQQDMRTPPLFPTVLPTHHHPLKKLQVTVLKKGALELCPQFV